MEADANGKEDPRHTAVIEALIAAIGPESMARVLDAMASDAQRLLTGLEQAVAANDAKAFSLYAHSLKSNSLTVGAGAVGALFEELESINRSRPLAALEAKVQQAQTEYRKLIACICHPGVTPGSHLQEQLVQAP
jgi:HPt (histidine-containing phosphotransfer) domain-containing protein